MFLGFWWKGPWKTGTWWGDAVAPRGGWMQIQTSSHLSAFQTPLLCPWGPRLTWVPVYFTLAQLPEFTGTSPFNAVITGGVEVLSPTLYSANISFPAAQGSGSRRTDQPHCSPFWMHNKAQEARHFPCPQQAHPWVHPAPGQLRAMAGFIPPNPQHLSKACSASIQGSISSCWTCSTQAPQSQRRPTPFWSRLRCGSMKPQAESSMKKKKVKYSKANK